MDPFYEANIKVLREVQQEVANLEGILMNLQETLLGEAPDPEDFRVTEDKLSAQD